MKYQQIQSKQTGSIFLILFGAVFFAVGVGTLSVWSAPAVVDYFKMSDWIEVHAIVENVELEESRGDDSTTYEVKAAYRYQYDGQSYIGDRVGLFSGSDNIGDWQHSTYSYLRKNNSILVWINPNNPRESIFDKSMRWDQLFFSSIFVIVFGGVGACVMILGWVVRRRQQDMDKIDGPIWEKSPEWRDNQILSNAKSGMWFIWFFAIFWNSISSMVIFIVPKELANGNYAVLIALIFPAVGIGLLIWAVHMTRQWKRFGKTPLILSPFPGEIGNQVGGKIMIASKANMTEKFDVTLACVRKKQVRSGDSTRTEKTVIWQDSQSCTANSSAYNQSTICFEFEPLEHLPPTSGINVTDGISWEVNLKGETAKGAIDRQWEIPVIQIGEPKREQGDALSLNKIVEESEDKLFESQDPTTVSLPDSIVKVTKSIIETVFYYPMFRSKSMLVGCLVGAVFVGLTLSPIFEGAPLLFPIVFGGVGWICLLGSLYGIGNSLSVTVDQKGIRTIRSIFGIKYSRQMIKSEIKSLQYHRNSKTTSGSNVSEKYSVYALSSTDKKITIAESLPDLKVVKLMTTMISDALDLDESVTVERYKGLKKRKAEKMAGLIGPHTDQPHDTGTVTPKRKNGKAVRVLFHFFFIMLFLYLAGFDELFIDLFNYLFQFVKDFISR